MINFREIIEEYNALIFQCIADIPFFLDNLLLYIDLKA